MAEKKTKQPNETKNQIMPNSSSWVIVSCISMVEEKDIEAMLQDIKAMLQDIEAML